MDKSSKQKVRAPKSVTQTGSQSANYHEAARSEYLAHYVFAGFGTCIPVPRQEDAGIDLYCTLTEKIGQRIWPQAYYTVQVKSGLDPWRLESRESVKWLVEHPLPVLLCYVLKKEARVLVYHTAPRFDVWSSGQIPDRVELVPGTGHEGTSRNWLSSSEPNLSAPILDFTIQDLLDDEFAKKAKAVLRFWIVDIEQENLRRKSAGVLTFRMPNTYVTNECGTPPSSIEQGVRVAEPAAVDLAIKLLREPLDWVSDQMCIGGDLPGGLRGMLLLRHLYGGERETPGCLIRRMTIINKLVGADSPAGFFTSLDEIGTAIDVRLINALDDPARLARVTRLCLNSAYVTDDTMEHLKSVDKLQYLDLAGAQITDKGLEHLANKQGLTNLFLSRTDVTDAGLASLKLLTQICKLDLGATRITDAGLSHLTGMKGLECLYLRDTMITGTGLVQLKNLPCLDIIVLTRCRVTNDTLLGLAILPVLRRVDAEGTEVTVEGAREMRKAVYPRPIEIKIT